MATLRKGRQRNSINKSPLGEILQVPGRRLHALAGIIVCSVPLGPCIFLLYITRPWLGIGAGALCLALLLAGVGLKGKPATWVTVMAAPFWVVVFIAQVIFSPVGWIMNPTFFVLTLVLSGLALETRFVPRMRSNVPVVAVLVLSAFVVKDMMGVSWRASALSALIGAAAVIATIWSAKEKVFSRQSSIMITLFILNIMVYPRAILSFTRTFPLEENRVLSQPGIRTIYDYSNPQEGKRIPSQVMFMARVPGTETYILGPHDPYNELLFLTAGRLGFTGRLQLDGRGGDNCIFDPEDPTVAYVLGRQIFYRVTSSPPRIINSVDLGYSLTPLSILRFNRESNEFLVGRPFVREIFLVDRDSLKVRRTLNPPLRSVIIDAWFDPIGHQILLCAYDPTGWLVSTYNADTLEREKTRHLVGNPLYISTVDSVGRRAYLGSAMTGRVYVLDLDTLSIVRSFYVEVGIRNLNFDQERRWLLASTLSGRELVYDVDRRAVVGNIFLGKQVRWVEIDSEIGKWFSTSSVGGFEIDPDKAFTDGRSVPIEYWKEIFSRH